MIFYITTMVLRDVRDTRTQKHTIQRLKTRADAKWSKRKSKKHRKKNRIKTKKNTNNSITFPTKRKVIIQNKEIEVEKDVCSICCEETKNLKYINCKRGGVQNINFGKYGDCCKDKAICKNCAVKCNYQCPFCKGHSLHSIKNKFKQKKASFAVKESRRRLKKMIKRRRMKKKAPILRVSVRRARIYMREIDWITNRYISPSTALFV
tara:strand:+ start:370 stop:990 length:621 start_codon:yes stop_codon:yes gene_type:complete